MFFTIIQERIKERDFLNWKKQNILKLKHETFFGSFFNTVITYCVAVYVILNQYRIFGFTSTYQKRKFAL